MDAVWTFNVASANVQKTLDPLEDILFVCHYEVN